jgi:hypothetical protein
MDTQNITISQDLIGLLGKKLYSNPLSVIVTRELIQNAVDASYPGSVINVTLDKDYSNNQYKINVTDKGIGMSKDTLINTFLCIGKTGKKSNDSIGGFGIAKVSLFACQSWQVKVDGYSIDKSLDLIAAKPRIGVSVDCSLDYDYGYNDAISMIKSNAPMSNKRIRLNKQYLKPYVGKVIEYKDGYKISLAKSFDNCSGSVIYRIKGLTQYISKYNNDANFNLIVDFDNIDYKPRDDKYPFSMSRESVNWSISQFVSNIMTNLVSDKNSAEQRSNGSNGRKVTKFEKDARVYYSVWGKGKFDIIDSYICDIYHICIELIKAAMNHDATYKIGLSKEDNFVACFKGNNEFIINPEHVMSELTDLSGLSIYIYHLAIHEYAHTKYSHHNEDFTRYEGELTKASGSEFIKALPKLTKIVSKIDRKNQIVKNNQ